MVNMSITNQFGGSHMHRTTLIDGQNVCMDCNQIVIAPILSTDDPRLIPVSNLQSVLNEIKESSPQGLDLWLIEIANACGQPWPNYVDQLADKYTGAPPHVDYLYDYNGQWIGCDEGQRW